MAGMFIITRALRTPRDVERREVAPCFVRQLKPFPEVRTNRVENMKT